MRRIIICLMLIGTLASSAMAQSRKIEKVMQLNRRSSGYIMEKDKLVGYYAFYKKDNVDKKTASFQLDLLDDNLGLVKSIDIQRPKNASLLEMEYNGKAFMMSFFDGKKAIDYLSYDVTGKKLGETRDEEIPTMERMMISQGQQQDGFEYSSIMPRGETGFIRQSYTKNNKLGYEIQCYDNNLKTLWNYGSDPKSDLLEAANLLYSSADIVIAHVVKKKGMMTRKEDTYVLIVDGNTGKRIMEKSMQDLSDLSLLSCSVDEEKKEIILSGEYYAAGDDQSNSKSVGLYFMTLDMTGAQKNFKKLSWAMDLAKVKTPDSEDKKDKNPTNPWIYWHSIERMKNGHYYAIGEQFKKTVSAMGVASMMLAGRNGAAAMSIHVYNMVVLEFDDKFSLLNYQSIDKKKTEVLLPPGSSAVSTAVLGKFVKAKGGFDFEFITRDREKDAFYAVYRDWNNKDDEGKKTGNQIGTITFENGKLSTTKFPITTSGSSARLSPAKPGYVAVTEYFRKTKTMEFRLEKLNY